MSNRTDDLMIGWSHSRNHPKWVIPFVSLCVAALVLAAIMVFLRVGNFAVRVIPDTSATDRISHQLPTDLRLVSAGWEIVGLIDQWRAADLPTRYAKASQFLSPKIRGDMQDYYASLKPTTTGLSDVAIARTILPIRAKVLNRSASAATVVFAYQAIDLIDNPGAPAIARAEIQVLELSLSADAITDENPYGVLAEQMDRVRGADYPDKFWKAP